nr:integrase, catalytic region, zinc finger, CCHC-type, peptidase aspartic, catalytic [Tanacetum cinerariifolium]
MINCIKNGDQPLPRVTQVLIAGTSSTEQPPLKDKSMWFDQEKKIQKIDRLARSLLIQGHPNDIYSLINSNKTAKDLWDALAKHMIGSEYGDVNDDMGLKKKTVAVTSDPLALTAEKTKVSKSKEKVVVSLDSEGSDAYDFSELKKITALFVKAFNRRKFYSKPTNNNLRTSSTSQSANRKQEFVKSDDKKVEKKDDQKKRDMSKVKCYNCKKEIHFAKDCKKVKVKDYEYYKTKMLLAKKDKYEQILLAEDQAWIESSRDSDQEINANTVFMAQIKKVLSVSEVSSSVADDKISEVSYYLFESESESEYETSEYYDNTTTYGLFINDNDDQEIFHDCENFPKNIIESQIDHNESAVDHNDSEGIDKLIRKFNKKIIADQEVLYDKMSVQLVELDKHIRDLKNAVLEKDFKISKLEECVRNKDLEIEKCLERLNVCENKLHKMGQTNQTVHMIMPSKDNMYNGKKGIGFENPSYFCKAKDLRPTLYDERVINLGYTLMFFTYSDEALEIKKFKRARENKIEFAYDYGSLNASYVNEKINFLDDYFQEIINPDFDKIDSSFQQTSSLKPYVLTMILEKIIIDLEDEVVSLLEKEKKNLKTIESLKSKDVETGVESSEKVVSKTENKSENDCQVIEKVGDSKENPKAIASRMFKLSVSQSVSPISVTKTSCASNSVENLDTLSSVRRPKPSGVMWMSKGSSNNIKADLSSVNHSNLNRNVNRYSRKNLMACNNSDTCSAFDCNNARNYLCNGRMNVSIDVNDLFVYDDVSIRKSHVSKMPFRKKPRDSLNIVQICLWIIDSGCSKHMTGNRALLTNFVEIFLGTVRFGNNDFTIIVGYGDVVIGSMTIKKVFYVEGLGHNLFSVV